MLEISYCSYLVNVEYVDVLRIDHNQLNQVYYTKKYLLEKSTVNSQLITFLHLFKSKIFVLTVFERKIF